MDFVFPLDVQCIDTYDLTRDGVPEILVGHGDGTVGVYVNDEAGEPRLRFKQVSAVLSSRLNLHCGHTRIVCA